MPQSVGLPGDLALAAASRIASNRYGFECGQTLSPWRGVYRQPLREIRQGGNQPPLSCLGFARGNLNESLATLQVRPPSRATPPTARPRTLGAQCTPRALTLPYAIASRNSSAVNTSMSAKDSFRLPTPSSNSASRESHPRPDRNERTSAMTADGC